MQRSEVARHQRSLLDMAPALDLSFPCPGRSSGRMLLSEHELDGSSRGVDAAAAGLVVREPQFRIGAGSNVEGLVGAFEDVDEAGRQCPSDANGCSLGAPLD